MILRIYSQENDSGFCKSNNTVVPFIPGSSLKCLFPIPLHLRPYPLADDFHDILLLIFFIILIPIIDVLTISQQWA